LSCSFRLPYQNQNPVCTCLLSHTSHMFCPWPSASSDHTNNISRTVHITKLTIRLSPFPCHFLPPSPKYLPQHSVLKHSAYVPPSMWQTKFHTHVNRQNYSSVYLNLYIIR
jgi:hypothetical protein